MKSRLLVGRLFGLLPTLQIGLLIGMVACCAAALAQQPDPDDDRGVPGEAEPAAVQAATDAEEGAGEPDSEPDDEFTPTEEIPEDYPVPLPSDI